ncbi:MAG: hypothetical protein WA982_14295 [Rubrobacteraceae bacterium]
MKLSVLRAFSRLAIVVLGAVGVAVPLGIVQMPLKGYAPVLFYFSLILLLLTLTLSRLGIFFAGLVRDRAGHTPDTPRYVSGIADRFVWPSATLLLAGCFLFTVSFIVQAA